MLIETKRQYVMLAQAGLAGNSPVIWNNAPQFLLDSKAPRAGIRCYARASNKFRALVPREQLIYTVKTLGLQPNSYYISSVLPLSNIVLGGELTWMDGDWVLYYSRAQQPMRDALAVSGRHIRGQSVIWNLLKQLGTPADVEDLEILFDLYTVRTRYPVIEFTITRGGDFGIFPRRNILIWEIRHY